MATFGQLLKVRKMKEKRRKDLTIPKSLSSQLMMVPEDPNPCLPVVERTMYIRMCESLNYAGPEMDWYVVKLSSNDCGGETKRRKGKGFLHKAAIDPIWKNVKTPLWSCCVPIGSTIYSIGGGDCYDDYSDEVRALDFSLSQFKQVAPMKTTRSCPHAVAVDDKIYVFGGNRGNPEIEVFDTINNSWVTVTPPSSPVSLEYCDYGFFAIYDDAKKRIICGSMTTKYLLAYDLTTPIVGGASWYILDDAFEFESLNITGAALVDNTLYWICRQYKPRLMLSVYDLETHLSASTTILGFDGFYDGCRLFHDQIYHAPRFFHFRDNEFYFIWHDSQPKHSLVRCSRILVSKQVDEDHLKIHLKAHVVTTKTYLLPLFSLLIDFVVLNRALVLQEQMITEDSPEGYDSAASVAAIQKGKRKLSDEMGLL